MVLGAFVDAGQVADQADGAVGVQVVAAVVAVAFQRVEDVVDEAGGDPVIAGHRRSLRRRRAARPDVGGDAGAGGGFPALAGPVAGDVEQVVIQGGGGAPVPGDGALAGGGGRAAVERGCGRGRACPTRRRTGRRPGRGAWG